MFPTFLIVLCIIAFFAAGTFFSLYTKFDHWTPKTGETLSKDAEVIDYKISRYNRHYYQAVIKFSDGFKYTSFIRAKVDYRVLSEKLTVDVEMQKEAIKKAVDKHFDLIRETEI